MADSTIGALPAAAGVYNDTLFAAEQQGKAVKITGQQLRGLTGSSSGSSGSGGTNSGNGFIEMKTSVPVLYRTENTLYGLILETYYG